MWPKFPAVLYPTSSSALYLCSFRNGIGTVQAFYSGQGQYTNGHWLSSISTQSPAIWQLRYYNPPIFRPGRSAVSVCEWCSRRTVSQWLDRLRHNDSTDLMRISVDIRNISAAHKNCVQARMADKAADRGYFSEFKDSACNKASSAATCIRICFDVLLTVLHLSIIYLSN